MNPLMNVFAQHVARQLQAQRAGQPQMSTPLQMPQQGPPAVVQALQSRGSKPSATRTRGRGMMLPPNQGGMQ